MGDGFRLQHLRLKIKDTEKSRHTFVNRDDEGGLRTPFIHAMTWPASWEWISRSAEIRVWAKAMLDGTYDVGREIVEPFILGAPGPESLTTLMERVCLDDEVISWVSEAFLEKRMKPAESSAPKTRF